MGLMFFGYNPIPDSVCGKMGLMQSHLGIMGRVGRRDDMDTNIDESDCIVIQKEGSEVRKRGVGLAGSSDPADADASVPSPEVEEVAVGSRGGWAMIIRRRSKEARAAGTSPQLVKTAKVFASSSELERKRKAE
jgi:hypothetical protein